MSKVYSLHISDGVDDKWVGDIFVDHTTASTYTYRFHRYAMWDDLAEVFFWACHIHGVDPFCSFLIDLSDQTVLYY